MSFGNLNKVFGTVQEALFIGLMVITMISLVFLEIDIGYKIGIAVLSFTVIFLATIANAILQQQKERRKQQVSQA